MAKTEIQRPANGCRNCGGEVRTYKPEHGGWVCTRCINDQRRRKDRPSS